ncbi:MAG: spore coat polysaccharide biosynthesis predicted glycosyltransferase SpsG [Parvicella sp.]|jgi:spore coat polysaccharide biosynthesis predicted glycosyltransferase SpsG/CMP-N-acetylneuraminic acid synthetase
MKTVWYLIPARAGSKTIPKKNIRELAGKPLIKYVIDSISHIANKNQIVISTDDQNVKAICDNYAVIHDRSSNTSGDVSTLDDVACEVAKYLVEFFGASLTDILITVQPTSPFIRTSTLEEVVKMHESEDIDSVLTVVDDRHLRWTIKEEKAIPLYTARVNRQQIQPTFAETGGVISSTIGHILDKKTRIGKNVGIIQVDEREGLDIDTFADWALAEYWAKRLTICIRVDGAKDLGFGHLYRSIAIAQNIHAHQICFVTRSDGEYRLGHNFLSNHHYPIYEISSNSEFLRKLSEIEPDIVINDILDTDINYVEALKEYGCFVVNFEDLGNGNRLADIVINDLYPDLYPKQNHWYGVQNAILNPSFEMIETRSEPNDIVDHILIAYGGTDPANLTVKAVSALISIGYDRNVTVILGPGHSHFGQIEQLLKKVKGDVKLLQNVDNMAVLMKQADLALTSAGRTVTELMIIGVPTITMCQNSREMRHNHASSTFGIVNLGFGESITADVLADHIQLFIGDVNLRRDMYHRMKAAVRERSNASIVNKILNAYETRNRK